MKLKTSGYNLEYKTPQKQARDPVATKRYQLYNP